MRNEMVCCGGVPFVLATSSGGRGKVVASFVQLACSSLSSLLILFVIVSVTEGVPTHDFSRGGGQKEMVMSGRSLYWPYSLGDYAQSATQKRTAAQPIQLCGYRLLEAVRGLCRGNYVGYNRRSDPDMQDERMMMDAPAVEQPESFDSSTIENQPKSTFSSFSPSTQQYRQQKHRDNPNNRQQQHLRFRRNIIDDCCNKPCSVNVMLRYCGGT